MSEKIKHFMPSAVFLLIIFALGALFAFLPKETYSETEKRLLAEKPTLSAEALTSGELSENIDDYVSDHFPARDLFVGVQAYYERLTGRGGASDVYDGRDGYLIGAPAAMQETHVRTNVSRFAAFAAQNDLDGTLMIVPSTGYILSDKLPKNHKAYADDAMFAAAQGVCGDLAFIDLREPFAAAAADGVPLYYKTDHHLTSAGSYEMYKALAAAQNFSLDTDYRVEKTDGFYGTMYAGSGYWLNEADTVELWYNDDLSVHVEVYDAGTTPTKTSDSVFFEERLTENDKYPVFLDGNHALVKITNPDAEGGKLLIVKDSFAHCATGFLAEQYSEIYMIDLRYYLNDAAALVKENGITEVLFLYGMESISTESANSSWLQPLR